MSFEELVQVLNRLSQAMTREEEILESFRMFEAAKSENCFGAEELLGALQSASFNDHFFNLYECQALVKNVLKESDPFVAKPKSADGNGKPGTASTSHGKRPVSTQGLRPPTSPGGNQDEDSEDEDELEDASIPYYRYYEFCAGEVHPQKVQLQVQAEKEKQGRSDRRKSQSTSSYLMPNSLRNSDAGAVLGMQGL